MKKIKISAYYTKKADFKLHLNNTEGAKKPS